jgi:hypothetical protein
MHKIPDRTPLTGFGVLAVLEVAMRVPNAASG